MKRKTWFYLLVLGTLFLAGTFAMPARAQVVIYVDAGATGANDGASWANAFTDLQPALDAARPGDEIWVAAGTYKPTAQHGGAGPRYASFQLINGVALYGGFDPSAGATGWEDRNWEGNPTILSGDIGTAGNAADNCYHVFYHPSGTDLDGAVLDGFTITGGNANLLSDPEQSGGGMYNAGSSPALTNITFDGNNASQYGGGMYNVNGNPTLANVTFRGNRGNHGAGMYNLGGSPTLTGCRFEDNDALNYGGGLRNQGGSLSLANTDFSGNTALGHGGGGMYSVSSSNTTLNNVTFSENVAGMDGGGGLFDSMSGSLVLTDVVFAGNSASVGSGGALHVAMTTFTLTNVSFNGNHVGSGGSGGGLYFWSSTFALNNVSFRNNYATGPGRAGAMLMFSGTGTMTAGSFLGNYTDTGSGGGAIWLNNGILTAAGCRFEGNSSGAGGALYNDNATVTLADSSLVDNEAWSEGGGIWNDNTGTVVLRGSTLAANRAVDGGGAYNTGALTLVNSTVSGNVVQHNGGGILSTATANSALFNVTVTGNVADVEGADAGDGGGLYYMGTAPRAMNSIVAGNLDNTSGSQAPDCYASGSPGGEAVAYSLLGDERGGCADYFVAGGNIVGSDPLLGRLAGNGGPTLTHALPAGSPARDAGNPAGCQDPAGAPLVTDQRGMLRPRDGGAGLVCDMGAFEAGPSNDAWHRAFTLNFPSGPATAGEYVDQPCQSRWYKFRVSPGSRVTAVLDPGNANLDLALFGDIGAAYEEMLAPAGESDLLQLSAEFAADAFSPFAYSPFAYSPFAYSPFAYSPFAYSPFAYSPDAYSPFAYSPFAYSPFAYSPFAYSPFAYSPFAYSPFAYSPFAYSPFAYSPFAYSPDPAYSSAQMQTLMAISAFDGTARELIEVNTWDSRGEFYLRVSGRNCAFDLGEPFMLTVTQDLGICEGVDLITRPVPLLAPDGGYQALFLTDWGRFDQDDPGLAVLQSALPPFAAAVGGTVVDVGEDSSVRYANAEADATPQCPYAKNQVGGLIKDIVNAYRDAGNPIEYIVLVGNDDVIPFFRYPDRAELGREQDYQPPVLMDTSSYASMTLDYILSQEAYGSTRDLALHNTTLPIPDLAVGRLVETSADILNMLRSYTDHSGSLVPASALVTGYDFLVDAAEAIRAELESGLGVPIDALITPAETSPQDREGAPPLEAPWPARMLGDSLLGSRHDLIFLAGHFSAQGALAADYETRLYAHELVASPVDLENALVYSAGCHSGYNIVNEHGVPYVTLEPDWAQAFARKGATFVGGTGYQYGDTDFLEYSERLYLEFTRELRCGGQPQSVGQALVKAKQAYLAGTTQMRGIDEKALLVATLFGLPMFRVDGLSSEGCPAPPPSSEVISTEVYGSDPGQFLGLRYADVTVASDLVEKTVPLRSVTDPGAYLYATYFSGTNGAVTSPAEPVLPLERRNVHLDGYVLRGAGFRGGHYVDLPGIPLTGGATTETRAARTPFHSDVLYPLQPWSVNYFAQLVDPGSSVTWLDAMPAQFVSDAAGDGWTGTWRRFDDMEFRLFYSNHTGPLDQGAVPSLAAPPAILQVLATSGAAGVTFQVRVAGDPAAGIQEVWVTHTGIPCGEGATCWRSLDLAQNAGDSTLWEATLTLDGTPAGAIRYMVQAANGVGLVSLLTNQGEYFWVDYDPAHPEGSGDPAATPESTYIEFQPPPAPGAYSTEAVFSAVLRATGGAPVDGQRLTFGLGAQQRSAVTDAGGSATVALPLHGSPGDYSVSATFAGNSGYQRSSAASSFTIVKQDTVLMFLEASGVAQYSDDALMVAELTDAAGRPMPEVTVLFAISGEGRLYAVSEVTNLLGRASPGRVPLPAGPYEIRAYFGQQVWVNDQLVELTDLNYGGASASGALEVSPEFATVTYTGETVVPEDSTTLALAATVTQVSDGVPGDLSLAWVRFTVRDQGGNWLGEPEAQADANGAAVATLDGLEPGTYQVGVTLFGGYFAPEPVLLQVADLSLTGEPVAVGMPVSGSATFIDARSPLGHTATWDWGDGATCDTGVGGECALIEPSGLTPGQVTGSHAYTAPGVYAVRLAVTDGNGHTAEAIYQFVVVYDPSAGFVTGGGWISSQAGWCRLDDACAAAAGKANFGFVSRYKKGASAPTGSTEFNFSAGGLNFHSEVYEWLVVNQSASNAQFKGSGTINGGASPHGDLYKFMIWAGDGGPDGGDTFRIQIWYEDPGGNEVTVYDNGFDQAIGGGSIVIHRPD